MNGPSGPPPVPDDPARERIVQMIPRVFGGVLLGVAALEFAVMLVLDRLPLGILGRATLDAGLLLAVAGPFLWVWLVEPYRRLALVDLERSHERQRQVLAVLHRQGFVARLQQVLGRAEDEAEALQTACQATDHVRELLSAEVRLAPSLYTPFSEGAASPAAVRCRAPNPRECVAIREGRSLVFTTSASWDACPFLHTEGGAHTSAACVPVSVESQAIGFVRALGPEHDPPSADALLHLEAIATHLGQKLGVLRALSSSERRASTDPLTGLINRRRLDERLREIQAEGAVFSLAMADLDRFKALNDTHGHAMGDRALRLFAHVLRSALRPEDVCARIGGEEFVVVLPGCPVTEAGAVLDRVRDALHERAGAGGRVPPFTVSFGVAEAEPGVGLEELLHRADTALYAAKRNGRDRVVTWEEATLKARA